MAEKNSGWKQPEIKVPETELEDSFAGFFSEEEEIIASEKGKKHLKRKNGPDILAVSEETDPGFVITEVVALDTGSEIVKLGEETEEDDEHEDEQELSEEEENLKLSGGEIAKEKFGADKITIEAQVYARKFYENVGFKQVSEEFLEDGIPHILMTLEVE